MTQHDHDEESALEISSNAGTMPEIPEHILELDYIFQSIANSRRRYLLYTLESKTEWSVRELATKLVAWETETPEKDVSQEEIDRMFASLYHAHIPKLVDERVIQFDADTETIWPGEYTEQVLTALAGAGASLDMRQEAHARSEMDDG
ncbi:hypothetical protein SAMN05421858_4619 [Haladaptatus litoreus]|uniref:DUF7344 domain-containing protein n=1 Tax=Haladaptatus litoreus TaxID=553468 RepID=A0A1N7EY11_9EURY|nr:hypothetical protein [Haladaptatus litoreus]SIR92957.1 hypothetical protein SAMN05421858_4619 [Haladaptatus litoreus]